MIHFAQSVTKLHRTILSFYFDYSWEFSGQAEFSAHLQVIRADIIQIIAFLHEIQQIIDEKGRICYDDIVLNEYKRSHEMNNTYLPGTIHERIRELRERDHISQADLAAKLGVSPSTLSRIENGATASVSSDMLIKLADIFKVSTDFLLGRDDGHDHAKPAGAANTGVISAMQNSRYFPAFSRSVARYADGALSAGICLHNNILSSALDMLKDYPDAKQDIASAKIPASVEMEHILSVTRAMVKDMKDSAGQAESAEDAKRNEQVAAAVTDEIYGMFKSGKRVTSAIIADMVLAKVTEACNLEGNMLDEFRKPIIRMLKRPPAQRRQKCKNTQTRNSAH